MAVYVHRSAAWDFSSTLNNPLNMSELQMLFLVCAGRCSEFFFLRERESEIKIISAVKDNWEMIIVAQS